MAEAIQPSTTEREGREISVDDGEELFRFWGAQGGEGGRGGEVLGGYDRILVVILINLVNNH